MRMMKSILLVLAAGGLMLSLSVAQDTDQVLENMLKSAEPDGSDAVAVEPAIVPVAEEPSPVAEELSPVAEELSPVAEEPAPVAEEPVPVVVPEGEALASVVIKAEEAAETPITPAETNIAAKELVALLEAEDSATLEADATDDAVLEPVMEEMAVEDVISMPMSEDAAMQQIEQLISVRLDKVGLEEAISLFAQLSGANIIVPELEEAAKVSVSLKDVEWYPALQSILDSYDYELYKKVSDSEVYSVRRRPEGAPEPQVVETFKLKYATVPNAAKLIKELLPADAKISEFASRNMLVVKSTESNISEVRTVLATIDVAREQVFIEAKFLELNEVAQEDLGIDWQVLQAYSAGTVGSVQSTKSRTITDTENKSRVTDINGLSYEEVDAYSDFGERVPGSGLHQLKGVTPTYQAIKGDVTTEVLTSVLSADEFRLVLSALEENQGVNIVSNPKIIVANEQEASIAIVRKEPNIRQERKESLNDQPDLVTYELDPDEPFFEYGIKLNVTPSINTSSNISVNISPSLTRKFADKQAGENTYPIIDEKSIQTIFSLSSGQTAAIGGLTEVEDSETERKVPVLGSIPYLGRLFSYKQTVHDQSETIIFVTIGLATVTDIKMDSGLPEDTELARRQVIKNDRQKILREQGRKIYELREDEKLEDMLKGMKLEEEKRLEDKRAAALKEAEKAVQKRNKELQEIAGAK